MTTFISTALHLRHRRICPAGKAKIIDATYAAFVKSRRGQRVLGTLKAIKAGVIADRTTDELRAQGKAGTLDASIYVHQHIGDMLEGRGTVDTINLLHSWMGHMLYCCIQRCKRYKAGHIERAWLDHSIRALCAGRRALFCAWQREQRTARVGFAGVELEPFKKGCSEGFFVSERISKSELRAAFRFADAKAKRQGLTIKKLAVSL